jgi:hypothetical protein
MVKKNIKYNWRYRDEYFRIKNHRDQIIQEINRFGYSPSRTIHFVNDFYAMTGITNRMAGITDFLPHPLSKGGELTSPPNLDAL